MNFKNLPVSYQSVSLSETELTDAIEGWLRREHPNITCIGILEGNVTIAAKVALRRTLSPIVDQKHVLAGTRTPTGKRRYNRENSGIGKPLKGIFSDGLSHDVGTIYTILKPNFPKLTRKKLIHNFYAIKGIKNLGNSKWQWPLTAQ